MSPNPDRAKIEGVQKLCRLCAGSQGPLIAVFSDEGVNQFLADKIHTILPIMVSPDDWLPQRICSHCISALDACHTLLNTCLEADIKLRSMLGICQIASPKLDSCLDAVTNWADLKGESLNQPELLADMDISAVEQILKPQDLRTAQEKEVLNVRDASPLSIQVLPDPSLSVDLCHHSSSQNEENLALGEHYINLDIAAYAEPIHNITDHEKLGINYSQERLKSNEKEENQTNNSIETKEKTENIGTEENSTIQKCNICDFETLKLEELKLHLKSKHSEANNKTGRKYSCQHCIQAFSSSTRLKEHERGHTGERPFVCEFCGKAYRVARSLAAHRLQHDSEARLYRCQICSKTFVSRGGYRDHVSMHSSQRFQCEVCGKSLKSRSSINKHKKTHIEPQKVAAFSCDLCDKVFRTRQMLEEHQRTHTGEKPFTCNICGTRFAIRKTLRNHMATHSNQRMHACELCGFRSNRRDNLSVHMRTHKSRKV